MEGCTGIGHFRDVWMHEKNCPMPDCKKKKKPDARISGKKSRCPMSWERKQKCPMPEKKKPKGWGKLAKKNST